jgi:uncharacterized protein (DUF427 family)
MVGMAAFGGRCPPSIPIREAVMSTTEKVIKQPGPDHPISIAPNGKRVRVTFAGRVVADTTQALTLQETTHPPRHYIPRADVDTSVLVRSEHHTYCPYKGEAAYYSIKVGDRVAENAIWTYEDAYPAVAEIAGHLAFYPNRVDAIEEITP